MTEANLTQSTAAAPADPPAGESTAPAAATEPPTGAPAEPRRRAVKLVITLEPTGDAGYRALLALGADGCDPSFRTAPVDGIPAALDEVPALLVDAEARWQDQPRYPAMAAPPRSARSGGATGRVDTPPSAAPARTSEATTTDAPAPKSAPKSQLDLFA